MADIFDVVADSTRRDLLQLLLATSSAPGAGELSVGQMVAKLALSQPTVSKQLKVLRDHGLVSVRDEGQHRYYSLNAAPLEDLEDWVIPFLSAGFDPSQVEPSAAELLAESFSSSRSEMGQRVGRAVADRSYRARSTLEAAQKRINGGIHRFTGR